MIKTPKPHFIFVYPDFEYNLTERGMIPEPGGWYHEGIAQLTSIIESQGWSVDLIHLTKPIGEDEFIEMLKKLNPTIIGFSVRTGVNKYAQELIKRASKLNKFIIVGSYHATLWPDEVINWDGVNAICIGEGENPVKDLVKNFGDKEALLKVGSLWVKDEKGVIHKNRVQPLERDLNSLPLPKFEIFDFSKLIATQIKAAVIVLTRGCPYNCTYCWNNFAKNLYSNKHEYVRYRSPENCIKYIKRVKEVYPQLQSFRFQDDLWPFYNDWFGKFSTLYIKEINIPFECHLRANLFTEDIIKRLKEMKCNGVYLGVESGNEYIRNKVLKRNMSQNTLITAFTSLHKYNIRTHAYNIVGLPYENMNKVLDTIKLNAQLQATDMFFPIWFPYAGSELYDIATKSGYFDPKKELDPYVNLEMPDFKRNQIRFASLYSKTFVRLYQFAFKLPSIFGKLFEKILDFLWGFPYWPFTILINWVVLKRKLEAKLKVFIKLHFYNAYLFLKK